VSAPFLIDRTVLAFMTVARIGSFVAGADTLWRGWSGAAATPVSPSATALLAAGGVVLAGQILTALWAAVPAGYAAACDGGLKRRALDAISQPTMALLSMQVAHWSTLTVAVSHGAGDKAACSARGCGVYLWASLACAFASAAASAWALLNLHRRCPAPAVPCSAHGAVTHACFWAPTSVTAAWVNSLAVWTAALVVQTYGASASAVAWVGVGLFLAVTAVTAWAASLKRDINLPLAQAALLALVLAAHTDDRRHVLSWSAGCMAANFAMALAAAWWVWRGRADAPAPAWRGGGGGGGGAGAAAVAV
jgi:hypothetical protein